MMRILQHSVGRRGLIRVLALSKPQVSFVVHKRKNSTEVAKGLAGVQVAESSVCTVGVTGIGLNYRGFGIDDLAQCTC